MCNEDEADQNTAGEFLGGGFAAEVILGCGRAAVKAVAFFALQPTPATLTLRIQEGCPPAVSPKISRRAIVVIEGSP